MKHGFRPRSTATRKQRIALNAWLYERSKRVIHLIQMDGKMLVSQELRDALQVGKLSAVGSVVEMTAACAGMEIVVVPHLPITVHETRLERRRRKWAKICVEKREAAEFGEWKKTMRESFSALTRMFMPPVTQPMYPTYASVNC